MSTFELREFLNNHDEIMITLCDLANDETMDTHLVDYMLENQKRVYTSVMNTIHTAHVDSYQLLKELNIYF